MLRIATKEGKFLASQFVEDFGGEAKWLRENCPGVKGAKVIHSSVPPDWRYDLMMMAPDYELFAREVAAGVWRAAIAEGAELVLDS